MRLQYYPTPSSVLDRRLTKNSLKQTRKLEFGHQAVQEKLSRKHREGGWQPAVQEICCRLSVVSLRCDLQIILHRDERLGILALSDCWPFVLRKVFNEQRLNKPWILFQSSRKQSTKLGLSSEPKAFSLLFDFDNLRHTDHHPVAPGAPPLLLQMPAAAPIPIHVCCCCYSSCFCSRCFTRFGSRLARASC
jgi:hypothetical protein